MIKKRSKIITKKYIILSLFFLIIIVYFFTRPKNNFDSNLSGLTKYANYYFNRPFSESTFSEDYRLNLLENIKSKYPNEQAFIKQMYIGTIKLGTTDVRNKIVNIFLSDRRGKGYIDVITQYCRNDDCSQSLQLQSIHPFVYDEKIKRWFPVDEDSNNLCIRDEIFQTTNSEFIRAINLITQRLELNDNQFSQELKSVSNCINIHYGNTGNAEGLFQFVPNINSLENLEIIVSSEYKYQDDLTTSLLLVHELTHAVNFVKNIRNGTKSGCYEDEALAFSNTAYLLDSLNSEEKNSINSRYILNKNNKLSDLINTIMYIDNLNGNSSYNKSLIYVKNSSYYIKQCTENNN